jgi:gamma-glutamylcyclotransferase (GGCT)/AIG2-like uncharacterized protein YtfP
MRVADDALGDDLRHVFVYGTLRKGDDNDITQLQPTPKCLGQAHILGVMYHLGAYPGVVLGGVDRVLGEVYAISPELERQLDEIEALYPQQTDEYFKRWVPIMVHGRQLLCIVYEINPAYIGAAKVIADGDWVRGRHG